METCRHPSPKLYKKPLKIKVSNYDSKIIVFVFSLIDGTDVKIVYRHYATLYFVFCVDSSESELGILDLIQVNMLMHL